MGLSMAYMFKFIREYYKVFLAIFWTMLFPIILYFFDKYIHMTIVAKILAIVFVLSIFLSIAYVFASKRLRIVILLLLIFTIIPSLFYYFIICNNRNNLS